MRTYLGRDFANVNPSDDIKLSGHGKSEAKCNLTSRDVIATIRACGSGGPEHSFGIPSIQKRDSGEVLNSIIRSNPKGQTPTEEAYGEWLQAYHFFNERLFGGELPDCIITMTRKKGVLGYYHHEAFVSVDGDIAHEIALNLGYIETLGVVEALSTLTHEMCHLWRSVLGPVNSKGKRGTFGYHDKVWADKMESIGLMPSTTGRPGGKRTGYAVVEYRIEGGPFDRACRELLFEDFTLTWRDRIARPVVSFGQHEDEDNAPGTVEPRSKADRLRFSCVPCKQNAWAKPSAKLLCGLCG